MFSSLAAACIAPQPALLPVVAEREVLPLAAESHCQRFGREEGLPQSLTPCSDRSDGCFLLVTSGSASSAPLALDAQLPVTHALTPPLLAASLFAAKFWPSSGPRGLGSLLRAQSGAQRLPRTLALGLVRSRVHLHGIGALACSGFRAPRPAGWPQ